MTSTLRKETRVGFAVSYIVVTAIACGTLLILTVPPAGNVSFDGMHHFGIEALTGFLVLQVIYLFYPFLQRRQSGPRR